MLKPRRPHLGVAQRAAQRGVVLLMALVVLVVIMVAGIAMMRSVDTATLVAGNLAFEQSATNAADKGIEQAIAMLQGKAAAPGGTALSTDDASSGYYATMRTSQTPAPGTSWQAYWDANLTGGNSYDVGTDQFGNHIWYVVNRECQNPVPAGAGAQCVYSPKITKASGNSQEAGEIELQSGSQVYYRIVVKVQGPRRTESYVQSHIAM
jgi:Tfp pilus assembly protein PilX